MYTIKFIKFMKKGRGKKSEIKTFCENNYITKFGFE